MKTKSDAITLNIVTPIKINHLLSVPLKLPPSQQEYIKTYETISRHMNHFYF